jgi:hypothetical protein
MTSNIPSSTDEGKAMAASPPLTVVKIACLLMASCVLAFLVVGSLHFGIPSQDSTDVFAADTSLSASTTGNSRELLTCLTDTDCPSLYCPAPPCTVFYCNPLYSECQVTTETLAPSNTGTTGAPTTNVTIVANVTPITVYPASIAPTTNSTPFFTADPTTVIPETFPTFTPITTSTPTQVTVAYAGNDVCTSAIGPLPMTSEGLGWDEAIVNYGTNVGASYSAATAAASCGGTVHNSPGVWYTVIGTGDRMTASTCLQGTNYDTAINVYTDGRRRRQQERNIIRGRASHEQGQRNLKEDNKEENSGENTVDNNGEGGGVCSSMTCVAANDDAGQLYCSLTYSYSRVSWDSIRGQTYYLLVHGFYGRTGNFALSVVNSRPMNARCDAAISLPIDATRTVVGTTYQSSLPWGENGQAQCGTQLPVYCTDDGADPIHRGLYAHSKHPLLLGTCSVSSPHRFLHEQPTNTSALETLPVSGIR